MDQALFRRFDDVLRYELPDREQIEKLFALRLGEFYNKRSITKNVLDIALGLSHAEITKVCEDCIKTIILEDRTLNAGLLQECMKRRVDVYRIKEA